MRIKLFSPLLITLGFVIAASGCSGQPAEDETGDQTEDQTPLPELARVAGAQDLWAFPFGLSASREEVETALGAPQGRMTDASRGGVAAAIVEWRYPGVQFSFFVRNDGSEEYLVSARVDGDEAPLSGPFAIGETASSVQSVLGTPQVESAERMVFFFSETTVEFETSDGVVSAITLARALP
jgi:hypothetical protein